MEQPDGERPFTIRILGTDGEGVAAFAREVEGLLLERGVVAEVAPAASSAGAIEERPMASGAAAGALVIVGRSVGRAASEAGPGGTRMEAPALEVALAPSVAGPRALLLELGTGPGAERSLGDAAAEVLLALERLGLVPASPGASYSDEDERKIAERLEDLGYL